MTPTAFVTLLSLMCGRTGASCKGSDTEWTFRFFEIHISPSVGCLQDNFQRLKKLLFYNFHELWLFCWKSWLFHFGKESKEIVTPRFHKCFLPYVHFVQFGMFLIESLCMIQFFHLHMCFGRQIWWL